MRVFYFLEYCGVNVPQDMRDKLTEDISSNQLLLSKAVSRLPTLKTFSILQWEPYRTSWVGFLLKETIVKLEAMKINISEKLEINEIEELLNEYKLTLKLFKENNRHLPYIQFL